MIRNPILPGFNADPSICRVGPDYYIATSTFEWYPGVQIHHSTDLVNWTTVTNVTAPASSTTAIVSQSQIDSALGLAPRTHLFIRIQN